MTSSNLAPERDETTGGAPKSGPFGEQPAGTGVGAAAGGLAGRGIADAIDTAAEEGYWRDNFSSRPYVKDGSNFEDCHGPAPRTPPATRGSTLAMRLNA